MTLHDVNETAVHSVNSGAMPFREDGADELLRDVVRSGRLSATTDATCVSGAAHVIFVVGTPLDEHMHPEPHHVLEVVERCARYLHDDQLLILRSTVSPGVTALVERLVRRHGLAPHVAYCPERIAEGAALNEISELPQLVGARSSSAAARAECLFQTVSPLTITLSPEEAELAKLFSNAWRYIKFAAANQFWMISNSMGLDFEKIRQALSCGYPRAVDLPAAGLAAGPCLPKDTIHLAAADNGGFPLGRAAVLINENMPAYILGQLEKRFDLEELTVGVLGMAFKGDSDDPRGSLSYRLRKSLLVRAGDVLCTDPFVGDERLVPLEKVLSESDLLVIATPHEQYRNLDTAKPVVDVWGIAGRGVLV